MRTGSAYDPTTRNGWARGLVHFHTRFSDGWASVTRAGHIARRRDYDFLVITDHLSEMLCRRRKTLLQYVAECSAVSERLGFPLIPGGEFETDWRDPSTGDFSQAHTLVLSVRDLQASQLAPWVCPTGGGTLTALQHLIAQCQQPCLIGHPFQHCLLSWPPGKHADYRYDLAQLTGGRYFDFFYSAAADLIHEVEDITLVNEYAASLPGLQKGVFASCDFHTGPEVVWPPLAAVLERFRVTRRAWRWVYATLAAAFLRLRGTPETSATPYFAAEQLSHATYVHLGEEPCQESAVLAALYDGRTCVTRGGVHFANLAPAPSFTRVHPGPATLQLDLPESYSPDKPRPRSVIVFRDGTVAHWQPYSITHPAIAFSWTDPSPLPGVHSYTVYVPSKFLSSPIRFST